MKPETLVVGAGPVGLTTAAELTRYGVGVRILDKAADRTDKSKALVLWSPTLELIDRMGCGATFVDAGLSQHHRRRSQIARINLAALTIPHPFGLMLPQTNRALGRSAQIRRKTRRPNGRLTQTREKPPLTPTGSHAIPHHPVNRPGFRAVAAER